MTCIFCEILEGKRQGYFIYEDKDHVAFLDRYPIDKGHSLVMPRKHYERLTDMSPDKVGDLFSKIPRIAKAVVKSTEADAFSLAQNNGKAAKQIVPHVHVHIIPRYNNKGTLWTQRNIVDDEELKALADKIRTCLSIIMKSND